MEVGTWKSTLNTRIKKIWAYIAMDFSTSRQIEEKIAVSAAFKVMEHGGFKFASM